MYLDGNSAADLYHDLIFVIQFSHSRFSIIWFFINTLEPEQHDRQFADDIFTNIFLDVKLRILIP